MGDFTKDKSENIWMPDYLQREMGQFNVFPVNNTPGNYVNCQPYNRKGFYKISLLKGHTRLYYADRNLEFNNSALLFSNPNIPYSWEDVGQGQSGYYCIFTESFFDQRQQVKDYPVFKPGQNPLFELSERQASDIASIFENMLTEIESDFVYKYDVLRNLTLELIYSALKMQPVESTPLPEANGPVRIAALFTELLERQFPIEAPNQSMKLRFPAEYADHLSVHINHLNRSLKKGTGPTTSQLIAARIMQEARILLQHTNWNISEIGRSLGFEELPHFINFFKKNQVLTPKNFRANNF